MVGIRVPVAPETTAAALAFVAAGIALGAIAGLLPGLHANNVAMILAAVAPSLPGPPKLVACAMLAAGVVNTFLDVVPALTLGVPDPAMAASALPGHRLVLQGRGREALRLSAMGSGLAVALAVPLAVPVTRAMVAVYPFLMDHLTLLLGAVALLLVLTERNLPRMVAATGVLVASSALGLATLDLSPAAPLDVGGMLTPLFAGLFGAPVLVEAFFGSGVPRQDDAVVETSPRAVGLLAGIGTLAGAAVGYLPGISSAVAATVALLAVPGRYGGRGFIVATSGVNTANTVFALFALVALGSPRTGVLVAVERTRAPLDVPLLLAAVAIAACVGFILVPTLGDRYLAVAGRVDYTRVSLAVLVLLIAVSYVFTGVVGIAVFLVAGALGLLPVMVGVKRVHLMGVLMGPLAVGL